MEGNQAQDVGTSGLVRLLFVCVREQRMWETVQEAEFQWTAHCSKAREEVSISVFPGPTLVHGVTGVSNRCVRS